MKTVKLGGGLLAGWEPRLSCVPARYQLLSDYDSSRWHPAPYQYFLCIIYGKDSTRFTSNLL